MIVLWLATLFIFVFVFCQLYLIFPKGIYISIYNSKVILDKSSKIVYRLEFQIEKTWNIIYFLWTFKTCPKTYNFRIIILLPSFFDYLNFHCMIVRSTLGNSLFLVRPTRLWLPTRRKKKFFQCFLLTEPNWFNIR